MSAAPRDGAYRRFVILLTAFAALAPLSIDAYLPAFPAIGAALAASDGEVQQTLTAYLAGLTLMALWHGMLSDALGRRPVVLAMTGAYAGATLVCLFASSIETLWLGRALQGLSAGAGIVIGRAMARERFTEAAAQRLFAAVAFFFALAPALAPVLGGWIHGLWGWRAIFAALALYACALWLLAWRWLPETLAATRRTPLRPGRLLRAHWHLLRAPRFLLLAASSALLFNGFFAYVLSAPAFLLKHLNLTPEQFYWLSFPAVAGIMGGSLLANRLSGRASHGLTIGAGFAVMLLAATLNVATSTQGSRALAVLPVAIYAFGMALATPSLTLLALDLFPGQRGIASGALGLVQMSANSLSAALLAPVLSESARGLALGMVGLAAAALAAYVMAVWAEKPGSRRGPTSGPSGRAEGPV